MWGCYFWQVRCNLWRDGEKYVKFGGDFVIFSSAGEWVGLFADRKNDKMQNKSNTSGLISDLLPVEIYLQVVRKMLRIGICDDQLEAREALRFQLEKVLREGAEQIVYEFSTGESAVRWLEKHPGEIDLLFLDVEMKGISGMEAAGQIREFDKDICIVFVTGYTDYVFDGYKVNALDYVIKPAGTERLSEILGRVREKIFDKKDENFVFKNPEGTYRIPLENISYFYSNKRKVNVVLKEKEEKEAYSFYGKLDEVEEQLSGAFVRIHQRYLVNPRQVVHIGGDSITVDGQALPMSRNMKEEATVRLAKAMLGGDKS